MKTSRKQILQSGVEKSMSSPEVFPASLFLAPDSERERKMTATSGRKCYERYGRFSPIGLLVKTLLESSQWYNPAVKLRWDVKNLCSERLTEKEYCIGRNTLSKQCVTTLNVKDISSNRLLFRLVPSERRTEETVSSLLPTVQTQGLKVCNENGKTTFYPVGLLPTPRAVEVVEHPMKAAARTKDRTGTKLNNLSSGAAFGLLPTPMASDATTGAIIGKNDQFVTTRNGTPRRINQNGQNGCVGLARMVRLLPTPNAREADKYSKKYNPNSQMGYKRVGCFPCVMASQQDIYNISVQEPERISYIAGLEQQFNSSFFGPDKISSKYYKGEYPLISDVVRYVQSKRAGGSLFDDDVATSCMSYYGLCE